MKRIEGSDVAQNLFGAGKDGFQDEDPGVVPATVVTTDWLNQVQEELLKLIEDAALTPDGTAQVRAAIEAIAWKFSNVNGIVAKVGDLVTAGDFRYTTLGGTSPQFIERTVMVPLVGAAGWSRSSGGLISTAANAPVEIPLPVKSGCSIRQVRVAYDNNGVPGAAPGFAVIRKTADKSTPGLGTQTTVRSDTDGTAGTTANAAQIMSTGTFTSATPDLSTQEWFLRITGSDNASGDVIQWVELTFQDAGPRNY